MIFFAKIVKIADCANVFAYFLHQSFMFLQYMVLYILNRCFLYINICCGRFLDRENGRHLGVSKVQSEHHGAVVATVDFIQNVGFLDVVFETF